MEEGKRQQLRERDEGEFQSFVNGKGMVYFVDAKHVTKEKVRFVQIIFSPSDQLPGSEINRGIGESCSEQKDARVFK